MASNHNTSNNTIGKSGKPSPSRNAAAAAAAAEPPPYDPRQFQNPHPDDIDASAAPRRQPGSGKGKTNTKAAKDTSGKAAADGSHCCYHCGTAGAKSCCGGCHRAW